MVVLAWHQEAALAVLLKHVAGAERRSHLFGNAVNDGVVGGGGPRVGCAVGSRGSAEGVGGESQFGTRGY